MTYRLPEHKPYEPLRTVVDTSTPSKVFVHNGTIAHLAFPCWYQEVHKPRGIHPHHRLLHDHYGWPAPDNPDHICQVWVPDRHGHIPAIDPRYVHVHKLLDLSRLVPIHLLEEGYTQVEIGLNANDDVVHAQEALNPTAYINPNEDWVIHVDLNVEDVNALKEPQRYKMSVFVSEYDENEHLQEKDLAVLTEVVVLPSSFVVLDYNE